MGINNKKKKKKPSTGGANQNIKREPTADVKDELLALESIYAESFVVDKDRLGFALYVVPHPGDMEENHACIELNVR
jgi:hypothetical protein